MKVLGRRNSHALAKRNANVKDVRAVADSVSLSRHAPGEQTKLNRDISGIA